MDDLALLGAVRARATLETALNGYSKNEAARMFRRAAWLMIRPEDAHTIPATLQAEPDTRIQKMAGHTLGAPLADEAAELSAGYVASIVEQSALDSIAKYARVLPSASAQRALVATGATGDIIAEGNPKIIRQIGLDLADTEPKKSIGLVVMSKELLQVGGPAVLRMFERELLSAVVRGANRSVMNLFAGLTATEQVGSTGDALADLRAGLQAAGPSDGYVVLGDAGAIADLALRSENRGAGIRGGEFVPGVSLVAIDGDLIGTNGPSLLVIPASRLTIWLSPVEIRRSADGAVDMRDTPQSPSQQVSLFQTGSHGLLVERHWHVGGDLSGAVQVG